MPLTIFILLLLQLAIVGYIDFRFNKIRNYWAILNLVLYFLLVWIYPDHYFLSMKTLTFPMAFLFVGYLLYLLKIMGAGDSKYLFSFYFLIPVELHEIAFKCLAYTTVFVGLFLITFTTVTNFKKILNAIRYMDVKTIRDVFGSKFSYAPVILVSWLWFGYEVFL